MKAILALVLFSVGLTNCTSVRRTNGGFRIKGDISPAILEDHQLNGLCRISGYVYSRLDSAFLPNANISFSGDIATTTDSVGEFKLQLRPGTYRPKAVYIGHDELIAKELKLKANQHAIMIFELGTTAIY